MRFGLTVILAFILLEGAAQEQPVPTLERVVIPGTEVHFELALIPAGSFIMESKGQQARITLDSFWMGVREVAFDEFTLYQYLENDNEESALGEGEYLPDAIARPSPPYTDITFGMGASGGFPAVSMTQQAALFYCYWLYQKTGQFYRLPTEAEWTYACLAGAEGALFEGVSADNLGDYAWHYENSGDKYHPVGSKLPNPLGLHDMLGNVAEWTLDQYVADYIAGIGEQRHNPWIKPARRYGRTVKGGSFDEFTESCDCRSRIQSTADWQKRDPQIPKSMWWNTDAPFAGFRLVRPIPAPSPEEIEAFFEQAIKW
jgi:formylglycine-generating enzyme required for sulfatase activity